MRIDDNEFILRCACGDLDHRVHLVFDKDEEFSDLSISLEINDASLWERIKNAILYIFKQRKFWHYGETLQSLKDPADRKEIRGLIAFLGRCLDEAPSEDKET